MRDQALKYLAGDNRLAVIASLSESFGFTVAECAVNGLPFIAARAGGTCEVIPDPEVQEGLFFEPNSSDLRGSLKRYFKMSPARRRGLRLRAQKVVDPDVRNSQMIEVYNGILERYRQESTPRLMLSMNLAYASSVDSTDSMAEWDADGIDPDVDSVEGTKLRLTAADDGCAAMTFAVPVPLVTVAIPYYNLGLYLPATLEAIAAQTYPRLEVIVVDDGSTCPISVRVFNELRELYPEFRFISQKNAGPGVARNRALAEARGEFFVPVDADNVPRPVMIERFVEGMVRNPDISVLTCFLKAFNHEEGINADVSEFVYMPSGGPFVLSCFENMYGDTNAIFRTEDFRNAGGFETDPDTFMEDWETFVRLAASGRKIDVIPEVLFDYRLRGDNRSLTMSRDRSDIYPFVQRMIERCFVPLLKLNRIDTDMLWLTIAAFGNHRSHRPTSSASDVAMVKPQAPPLALRYRVADKVNSYLKWITPIHKILRSIIFLAAGALDQKSSAAPTATEATNQAGDTFESPSGQTLHWPKNRRQRASRAA